MKKTCNTCEWFVEETRKIGDYSHEEAKRRKHGFCLVKDLFTETEPNDNACKGYREEDKKA